MVRTPLENAAMFERPVMCSSKERLLLFLLLQYQSFKERLDLPMANPKFQSQCPGLYST